MKNFYEIVLSNLKCDFILIALVFLSNLSAQENRKSNDIQCRLILQPDSIIYVDDNNTTGPWDGTASFPFQNIPVGLSAADSGVTVYVLPGNYPSANDLLVEQDVLLFLDSAVIIKFSNNSGLLVNGNLLAFGSGNDSVVLTASENSGTWKGVRFEDAQHSELRFCRIEKSTCWEDGKGGAVYAKNATLNLHRCLMQNSSTVYGAGIYCDSLSNLTLNNCEFSGNSASNSGGAIYATNSSILDIENCGFDQNTASVNGGAIMLNNANATIENCTFNNNEAEHGGAINLDSITGEQLICQWNHFKENSASSNGGAVFFNDCGNIGFERNVFIGNAANYGGVASFENSEVVFANNTLFGNEAYQSGGCIFSGPGNSLITNNILWNTTPDSQPVSGVGMVVSYNNIQEGHSGIDNFSEDPLFINTSLEDFTLGVFSSCIDRGNPASPKDADSTIADVGAWYYHHLPLEIIDQPEEQGVDEGLDVTFSLHSSPALAYRWQESSDDGQTWIDLNDTLIYDNVFTRHLHISDVALDMHENLYRCKIRTIGVIPVYSEAAMLKVYPLVSIIAGSDEVCPGMITIPVSVVNLLRMNAMSLTLNYNPSLIEFEEYNNVNDSLEDGTLVINASMESLFISWFSTETASIENDTLFNLIFNTVGTGTSGLVWDTLTPGNCEIINFEGHVYTDFYTNGSATIFQPPDITGQPEGVETYSGENTSFSVSAAGTGLSYEWQVSENGGADWVDLQNTPPYSGAYNNTLSITEIPLGFNDYQFRCFVTGTCTPFEYTNPALLNVIPAPQVISTSIPSQSVCPGEVSVPIIVENFENVFAFSLTLENSGENLSFLEYQNEHAELASGSLIVNSESDKLILTWYSMQAAMIGNDTLMELVYTGSSGSSNLTWDVTTPGACEYSDFFGNVIETHFENSSVTVYYLPEITQHPVDATIYEGEDAVFNIGAGGYGLSYHWQYSNNGGYSWNDLQNNFRYSGVTSSQLTVKDASLNMGGYSYRCLVTGYCPPEVFSDGASMQVLTPPQLITTSIPSVSSCVGTMVVPVAVENCDSVSAISLSLYYDTSLLVYTGYQSLHEDLESGFFILNPINNKLILSWASTQPAMVGDDVLIELLFEADEGTGEFAWDLTTSGGCEYSDYFGNSINADFIDGTFSVSQCTFMVDINVFLEGAYSEGKMTNDIVNVLPNAQPFSVSPWNYNGNESVSSMPVPIITDWVLIELRETSGDASTATESTIVSRNAALLRNDGEIVGLDGGNLVFSDLSVNENLFLVIRQRNHIDIMSSVPINLNGNVYSYDFTTNGTTVFQPASCYKEIDSGIWGMVAGDGNADGLINLDDISATWNNHAGKTGYYRGDFNLDSQVDNKDKNGFWFFNQEYSIQIPE